MMDGEIQLVVFDLGGVLIRLAPSWRHAFERAGIAYPNAMENDATHAAMWELVKQEEVGALGDRGFFEKAGPLVDVSANDLIRVFDAYLCGAFPGVDTLIDDLAVAPVQTACLSNTNHNHWKDLANPEHPNGLPLHKLDHRFASQLVGHRKPDPGIYQHLEAHTGITTNRILFFDDREDNCDAARQHGWHAHQVQSPDDPVTEMRGVLQQHGILTNA